MRSSSKAVWVVGVIVVALTLGAGIGLWLSQQGDVPPPPVAQVTPPAPQAAPPPPAEPKPQQEPEQTPPPPPAAPAEPEEEMQPENGWGEQLSNILLGDGEDKDKADSILGLLISQKNEEAHTELAQHLINMVQDDNYAGTAGLLTNAATAQSVSSVLMNDLLNRSAELKLPLLLSIARTDEHPLKGEAKEMLELFIQEDKGTNWDEWDAAIQKWLKDNAPTDEEKPADENAGEQAPQ